MFSTIYPYLLQLFSHFVFLFCFLFLTLLARRHILQFIMFNLFSLHPARNITKIDKYFILHDKKKCRVNYNQLKCFHIMTFSTKYEFFLPTNQLTVFLTFGQAKIFFSYDILMNIIRMNCYKHIVTRKSLNNIPYRKLLLNYKQNSKMRKENVLIKCLSNKVLSNLLHYKDIVKPYYIKGVQMQPFVDDLQNGFY